MTQLINERNPSSPPPPPSLQTVILPSSLKERRRSHLKPLRIAPTSTPFPQPTSSSKNLSPTPPPSTSATSNASFSSLPNWKNARSDYVTSPSSSASALSRQPSPPSTTNSSVKSTPYPISETSSFTTTAATSASSSSSSTPTFNQKITYSNQLPPKQKRRRRSPEEFAELMTIFEKTPKPCRQLREHLSRRLNMSIREVQIWFQNQRAKISRQARLTPSITSTSNRPLISSPTRRNTYPIGDDGNPRIPMTAIGMVRAHPYAASPYRQATYPSFPNRGTNSYNRLEDQDLLADSTPILYPASPVSMNHHRPSMSSLSTYYGEGATLPATTGSTHQRSQSQPQLFSYSNYDMDDIRRHNHHLQSYPDSQVQRYAPTKGYHTSFASSGPVTPTSPSPPSIASSEERRQVTDEEVRTFADAMSLLAQVAAQDTTQKGSLNVGESCENDRGELAD